MGKASRRKRERRLAPVAPEQAARRLGGAWLIGAAAVLPATAVVLGLVAWRSTGSSGSSPAAETSQAEHEPAVAAENPARAGALPGLQAGKAAWVAEQEQLSARLDAIGVPFSNMEGTALHIHPRLSVFVNGEPVTVPTDIGISSAEQAMAALHTHDTVGTIHVESPVVRDYTLGQFFDVWGVRLTKRCIGGYCAGQGKQLRAFVDGEPVAGSPRSLKLADGQQIVVAFGTPAQIRRAAS